jgi:hypothetical protein
MERIIAGRFHEIDKADAAATSIGNYVDSDDICIFHNNAPGQHDAYAVGGDEDEDPGAEGAGDAAVITAVAGGLAAGAVGVLGGPVVAVVSAAGGAYLGSLAGAIGGLGKDQSKPQSLIPDRRPGGVMLAVRVADLAKEEGVITALRANGAEDIEKAYGHWEDGDWTDFNPLASPQLVDPEADSSVLKSAA